MSGFSSSVENCVFVNNSAVIMGGAIWLQINHYNAGFTVANSYFDGNFASNGGAIAFNGAECTVKNCSFVKNRAKQDGGAFYVEYSDRGYNIEYCSFVNNTASFYGTAIHSMVWPHADNNWWGSNNPAWEEVISYRTLYVPSTYVVLNGTADTQNTTKGSEVKLSYAFYKSGTSEVFSEMCRPIELSATAGDLGKDSGYLVNGEFSTEFWSYWLGEIEIAAIVDNQEIKINISVEPTKWYVNSTVASSGNGKSAESAFKTLQEALDVAIDDDTIMIASGTYTGTNNTGLVINNITHFVKYGDGEVIFDACGDGRIWSVTAGRIYINGLTFKNGKSGDGGALSFYSAPLQGSIINATFINNTAEHGGAIYCDQDAGDVTITGEFIGNSADLGSAFYFFEYISFITISGDFINNTGQNLVYAGENGYENFIRDSIFINNNVDKIVDADEVRINFIDTWFGNNATNYNETPSNVGIDLDNWLFLNATADPDELAINEASAISFKLYSYNANSPAISEYNASKMNAQLDLTQTLGELNQVTALVGEKVSYTARQRGNAGVTGKFETASYKVNIVNFENASVSVNNDTLDLNVGGNFTIVATTAPEGLNVTFVPDDSGVVNVDENGVVTALKEGSATITVTINEVGYYANSTTVAVNVTKVPTEIIIANDTLDLKVLDEVATGATLIPAGAGNLTYISSDYDIVIVENDNIVPLAEGSAVITVCFDGDDTYAAAEEKTISVTISLKAASVSVENDALNLNVGDNSTIVATTTPKGLDVTYVPDDSGVVSVDDYGVVTALKEGTALITVKVGGNGVYVENSTTVTVTVKVPTAINAVYNDESGELVATLTNNVTGQPIKGAYIVIKLAHETFKVKTNSTGQATLSTADIAPGSYVATVSYKGSAHYLPSNTTVDVAFMEYANITAVYDADANEITVTLVGNVSGKALKGAYVYVKLGNTKYKVKIDANGQGKLSLANATPGNYTVSVAYNGGAKYYAANTTVDVAFMGYANITAVYDDSTKDLTVTLVNNASGNAIKGAYVYVKVDGKTSKVKIDATGQGKLSLTDLAPGTYDAILTYKGSANKYYPANTTAEIIVKG